MELHEPIPPLAHALKDVPPSCYACGKISDNNFGGYVFLSGITPTYFEMLALCAAHMETVMRPIYQERDDRADEMHEKVLAEIKAEQRSRGAQA